MIGGRDLGGFTSLAQLFNKVINVTDFGATGAGRLVGDAAMTAASAILTSATANFTAADIGSKVGVYGAGAPATWGGLYATILSVQSATSCTLSVAATNTVGSAMCAIGPDDSAAFIAAINKAKATIGGATVYVPTGMYLMGASSLTLYSNILLLGAGRTNTFIYGINNFNTPVVVAGSGSITDQAIEVRNLTVAMVGPNARNLGGHGIDVIGQRFLLDNVEVSLPQKVGTLDNGAGAAIAVAAVTCRYTASNTGTIVESSPPAVGDLILIDAGGTGPTSPTLNQFSEIRTLTSVVGLGGNQYTIGWAGGLTWGHQVNCRGEDLAFSVPAIGIAVIPGGTTQSAGPGTIRNCVVRASIADGIFLANCNHIEVSDSEIYATGDDGISTHSGNGGGFGELDAIIVNNRIEHAGSGGITIRGGQRYVIANNDIKMTFGNSIWVFGVNGFGGAGNSWYQVDACHILNNLCFGAGNDPQPSYGLGAGTALPTVTGMAGICMSQANGIGLNQLKIDLNRVRFFKGPAIVSYALDAVAGSVMAGLAIENNVIQSQNLAALTTGQNAVAPQLGSGQTSAIFCEKDANANVGTQITNNSIGGIGQEAIWVASNMLGNVVMSNNFISSINQSNTVGVTAIRCQSAGICSVSNNLLNPVNANVSTSLDMTGAGIGSLPIGNTLGGKPIAGLLPTLTAVNAGLSASSVAAGSNALRGTINITVGGASLAAGTNLLTLNWVPAFKDASYVLTLTDSSGHSINYVYSTKAAGSVVILNADQILTTVAYTIDYAVQV